MKNQGRRGNGQFASVERTEVNLCLDGEADNLRGCIRELQASGRIDPNLDIHVRSTPDLITVDVRGFPDAEAWTRRNDVWGEPELVPSEQWLSTINSIREHQGDTPVEITREEDYIAAARRAQQTHDMDAFHQEITSVKKFYEGLRQ